MPRLFASLTSRRVALRVLPPIVLLLSTCIGLLTMALASSSAARHLAWEWPAGRRTDRFVAVKLTEVAKEGGGLFGIRRSPSLADSLPDAMILTGAVVAGTGVGDQVRLRAPGADLPPLVAGNRAAFGLVDDRTCICVLAVPAGIADDQLATWLSHQSCGE